jgi:hypothetical protein
MILHYGWKELSKEINRHRKSNIAKCDSCIYFYSDDEDENGEDVCHNSNVIVEFDVIERDNGTEYCHLWSSTLKYNDIEEDDY